MSFYEYNKIIHSICKFLFFRETFDLTMGCNKREKQNTVSSVWLYGLLNLFKCLYYKSIMSFLFRFYKVNFLLMYDFSLLYVWWCFFQPKCPKQYLSFVGDFSIHFIPWLLYFFLPLIFRLYLIFLFCYAFI